MSKLSSKRAVSVLLLLAASACEEIPDLSPEEQDDGDAGSTISQSPIVTGWRPADAGQPRNVVDAGAQLALVDSGNTTLAKDASTQDGEAVDASPPQDTDAGPVVEPDGSFESVFALLGQHCVGCHGAGKPLDVSTPVLAYLSLVGIEASMKACGPVDGGIALPRIRVVIGSPESSLLMAKLENRQDCGKQMPITALLPEADVAVFRAWVKKGALPIGLPLDQPL